MPYDEVRANVDPFAREVLPALHAHDVGGDIGVMYGAVNTVETVGALA